MVRCGLTARDNPSGSAAGMNERERVSRCIGFETVDRVPWQIDCTSELARAVMENRGIEEERFSVLGSNIYRYNRLYDHLGNHLCFLRSEAVNSFSEVKPGLWRDEWGVVWDRSIDRDIGVPVNIPLERMDLKLVQVPDLREETRFAHFPSLIERNTDRYRLAKISRCLFERAWSLRGMENLLVDFKENPCFVHDLFQLITDFYLDMIEALGSFDIHGIRFSDDWGGQLGMLMSPETWRSFLKPYLRRLYASAHERGFTVFIHSCGNIGPILGDLIEIGVDVFNPLQPETMDVEEIFELYGGRLAFYGGLSIQRTLPFGTPDEVRMEVRHRLALARRVGGYIVAPSHDMPPDVPPRNVEALLDELRRQ
jgi:uroporphyrinogen decarboxylase